MTENKLIIGCRSLQKSKIKVPVYIINKPVLNREKIVIVQKAYRKDTLKGSVVSFGKEVEKMKAKWYVGDKLEGKISSSNFKTIAFANGIRSKSILSEARFFYDIAVFFIKRYEKNTGRFVSKSFEVVFKLLSRVQYDYNSGEEFARTHIENFINDNIYEEIKYF